jgi:hypothetical protein
MPVKCLQVIYHLLAGFAHHALHHAGNSAKPKSQAMLEPLQTAEAAG